VADKPADKRRRTHSHHSQDVALRIDAGADMAAVVGTEILDRLTRRGCSNPECTTPPDQHTAMYIEQKCHPQRPVSCWYDSITKQLVVECMLCRREVIRIEVASIEPEQPTPIHTTN
jgi:hypothetical protein